MLLSGSADVYRYPIPDTEYCKGSLSTHEILSASTWLDFKWGLLGNQSNYLLRNSHPDTIFQKSAPIGLLWGFSRLLNYHLPGTWNMMEYGGLCHRCQNAEGLGCSVGMSLAHRFLLDYRLRMGTKFLTFYDRCAWISCAKTSLVACSILIT